jgi:hypothetical protein
MRIPPVTLALLFALGVAFLLKTLGRGKPPRGRTGTFA